MHKKRRHEDPNESEDEHENEYIMGGFVVGDDSDDHSVTAKKNVEVESVENLIRPIGSSMKI